MSFTREAMKKALLKYGIIIFGCAILSFGLYNIHEQADVTEGGVLGMTLLLEHWFRISPAVSSLILNVFCYALGLKFLGRAFLRDSLIAAVIYSLIYGVWELFPPILPSFAEQPLLAALLGAVFVGVGAGVVVCIDVAPGGDDALALVLAHVMKKNVGSMYVFCDLTVLLLSTSYIPLVKILYSLLTVTLSSFIIWGITFAKSKRKEKVAMER